MISINQIEPDIGIWGGKIYGVALMNRLGLLIPESYVLDLEPYTIGPAFYALNRALNAGGHASYAKICDDIHDAIDSTKIDVSCELTRKLERGLLLVVRSSAAIEDGADKSLAGCYETYFGAASVEDLIDNIKKCWKSAYRPELLEILVSDIRNEYRMAILVQHQISCEKAGVYFSVDPLNKDTDDILIEANWGNCVTIVGGDVCPDRYWLNRKTMKERVQVGEKHLYAEWNKGKVSRIATPCDIARLQCLSTDQLQEVLGIAARIEPMFDGRADIEWGFMDGRCYTLQCRPITA